MSVNDEISDYDKYDRQSGYKFTNRETRICFESLYLDELESAHKGIDVKNWTLKHFKDYVHKQIFDNSDEDFLIPWFLKDQMKCYFERINWEEVSEITKYRNAFWIERKNKD